MKAFCLSDVFVDVLNCEQAATASCLTLCGTVVGGVLEVALYFGKTKPWEARQAA